MEKKIIWWKCEICGETFPTDGDIKDEAMEHTIEAHMDYTILGEQS